MVGSGLFAAANCCMGHRYCREALSGSSISLRRPISLTAAIFGSTVGSDLGEAWADVWHRWPVIIPRRSIAGRLVGERYGGAIVVDAESTRISSSVQTAVIRKVSPKSRRSVPVGLCSTSSSPAPTGVFLKGSHRAMTQRWRK
jgi:hypothetical protein